MLPSLTKHTAAIFLHPEYVSAVNYSGVIKKHVRYQTIIDIKKTSEDSEAIYKGIVDALETLLNKPEWQNCKADIILASDFAKFRVVPWHDDLTKQEQKNRVLDQLQEIYGVEDGVLHVFISDNGYRKSSLAFGMNKNFYDALKNLEASGKLSLRSIQPYFAVITNFWRKSIKSSAWIIIKEDTMLHYAKLVDNSWAFIQAYRKKDGWEAETAKMLNRDDLQSDETSRVQQVYFHDEQSSNVDAQTMKALHENLIVLGRNLRKNSDQRLSFLSYLK